jgi:cation diffusion facilitator family transporter
MAVGKGVGGYLFNSQSMIADAWHSLTDLASDILTLATVSWSIKPPSSAFPTGFGKIESLGSLGVSGMLLGGGLFMFYSSSIILYTHFLADPAAAAALLEHVHTHGHSHSHGGHGHGHGLGPSLGAAWLAAGTVVVKEWLYRATMKVAKERKSSVLASNAVHHRVDSLTGIVTLAAVLGANFLHNAAWLDPVGGLLISLLVIRAGFGNTVAALGELADKSIDSEIRGQVQKAVKNSLKELETSVDKSLIELRDVQGTKSGQNYLIDLEVAVPNSYNVEQTRELETAVRSAVAAKVRGVRRLKVRFIPKELDGVGLFEEFIAPRDMSTVVEEPHDHDHDHEHEHANGNGHAHTHEHAKEEKKTL